MEVKVAQSSPTLCDPIPSPADLPDPGIELGSPALQADYLPTELSGKLKALKESFKLKPHLNWLLICTINFLYYLCFLDFLTASPPLLTWFVVMISSSFPNFQSCYVFDQISLSLETSLLELFFCSNLITIWACHPGTPLPSVGSTFCWFCFFSPWFSHTQFHCKTSSRGFLRNCLWENNFLSPCMSANVFIHLSQIIKN